MSSVPTPKSAAARGAVVSLAEVQGYSPANHHGTLNKRLIGPSLGARHMEVVYGEIQAGGNALPHAHPGLEQAAYVLEGNAVAGIDGEFYPVGPGDIMFFPEGVFHSIDVKSDVLKLLVIYAPPYNENPDQVVRS